jgi:hypothetical protein
MIFSKGSNRTRQCSQRKLNCHLSFVSDSRSGDVGAPPKVVDLLIARLESVELVEDEEFLVPAMDCDSLISFSAWLCTRERVIH